jgi:hypothetical protein
MKLGDKSGHEKFSTFKIALTLESVINSKIAPKFFVTKNLCSLVG